MKQRNIFATVAISAMLLASCNDAFNSTEEHVYAQTLKSRSAGDSAQSYNVSEALVQTYVHLTSPNRTVSSITPIIRNVNDTLAYVVQYAQGWDLISGDTRMAPRLAYNATDTFNMADYAQNGAGGVLGMIDLVAEKRLSNDTILNPTWQILLPRTKIINPIMPRNLVAGMWRPVDTTAVESAYSGVNHLISTHWHQWHPYNRRCGFYNNNICVAGCVPIAVGQTIYHYNANYPNCTVPLPTSCFSDTVYTPTFSNFSSSQWMNLENDLDAQAIFISYIGHQKLSANYTDTATSVTGTSPILNTLNWAGLTCQHSSQYNISNILSSLSIGRPVIVCAENANKSNSGHAFIIDSYKQTHMSMTISYEWVDGYHPTDYEFTTSPMWMFDPPQKDDEIIQEETPISDTYYIAMNWGWWNWQKYNSVYYLAYDVYAPYYLDNIYYDGAAIQYAPNWNTDIERYNRVTHVYYNIHRN